MSSSSKIKKMYTRSELDMAAKTGNKHIFDDLANKIKSGRNDMSMAESELGCSYLAAINCDEAHFDLATFPICEACIFVNLYLRYWNDLDGKYGIEKRIMIKENRYTSRYEKEIDVAKLNSIYGEWKTITATNRHKGNALLNIVINETNFWLHKLEAENIDYRDLPYKIKAIKLNSKYVYLTVKEFFEEHGQNAVMINYNGEEIEIDVESVVHILTRHFAGASKQFDMNKSFHLDKSISWRYLAYDLKAVIERIDKSNALNGQDFNRISFRMSQTLYTCRTEKKSKNVRGKVRQIYRLGTFYPVTLLSEVETLKNDYHEIIIDDDLSVLKLN